MAKERLRYIDALRGLGAVAVALFWHYQHFAAPIQPNGLPFEAAPGFHAPILGVLYRHGDLGVDLFFLISGVVFAHTYQDGVGDVRWFVWHRVARIYPLHLLTLIVTAVLAWSFAAAWGRWPIYQANGPIAFALNVTMLQGLEPQRWWRFSFDGPAWTLSIEALLYAVFVLTLRRSRSAWWQAGAALLGLAAWLPGPWEGMLINKAVPQGLACFFTGALIERLTRYPRLAHWLMLPGFVLGMGAYLALAGRVARWSGLAWSAAYPTSWLLFGALILALRLSPVLARCLEWRVLLWLGDASLSIYLLHVPIQIALLGLFARRRQSVPLDQGWFWMAYAGMVLALAWICFETFERPLQRKIRKVVPNQR